MKTKLFLLTVLVSSVVAIIAACTGNPFRKQSTDINVNTETVPARLPSSLYQLTKTAPQCPSSAAATPINVTQSPTGIITSHCTACGLGALYEKNGAQYCTYCN